MNFNDEDVRHGRLYTFVILTLERLKLEEHMFEDILDYIAIHGQHGCRVRTYSCSYPPKIEITYLLAFLSFEHNLSEGSGHSIFSIKLKCLEQSNIHDRAYLKLLQDIFAHENEP